MQNPKSSEYKRAGLPLTGPWSNDSQLGQRLSLQNVTTILTGSNKQSPYTEFSSQTEEPAAFKMGEFGPPQVWSVSLYPEFNRIPDQDVNFNLGAILKFGTGGAMQTVEVDIENGVTISAPMNSVDIRIDQNRAGLGTATPFPAGWDYLIPPDLSVIYTVARGTSIARLPRKTRLYTPRSSEDSALADQNVVPIPPFASHVTVVPVPSFGVDFSYDYFDAANQLLFYGSPDTAVPQPPIAYIPANELSASESVVIPDGARGIAYRNTTSVGIPFMKLRFLISI